MTVAQLIALDLVVAIVTTGPWLAAAVVAAGLSDGVSRGKARLALGLIGLGLLALIAQAIVIVLLAQHGWWFVQEKVVFALPLVTVAAVIAAVVAAPPLVADARGSAAPLRAVIPTVLVAAASACVAGIAARELVGYPLSLVPGAALLALVLLVTWLSFAVFARLGRRLVAGVSALTALVVVASVGFAWLGNVAGPGALASAHPHGTVAAQPSGADISVTTLRTPADATGTLRSFDLTAQHERVTLASGATVNAWSYGSVPGPALRVSQGDLVEVTLHNADIDAGVTIHWHGYDVPNGEDGVAGVTQDAVLPGESFTYRFEATQTGTYWYHTHQLSADGVKRGLFGTFVVLPADGISQDVDLTVPVHTLGGRVLLGASDAAETRAVPAGQTVRLRLINTDQLPRRFRLTGAAFKVAAVDGGELAGPTAVEGVALRIPAGGRYDVTFTMPSTGVRLTTDVSSRASLTLTPGGAEPGDLAINRDAPDLDLLSYGTPTVATLPVGDGLVEATMVVERLPRFVRGLPTYGYTINGDVFPHIPSIEVTEGNVLQLTVVNRGWETHPMHVHGHHVLVLSRNGIPSTGSPLWLDTFDVQPGEVWVVTLVANNPGIWMDHCHNLDHAARGMMMALTYRGVTSPYDQGGTHGNSSE